MVTETEKSEFRRIKEGFIEKFCGGKGIDIGCGTYKIKPDVVEWDKNNGDATFVSTIEDSTYDYVYSSHCLEHLYNPVIAIFNWWRILKPNGYLIITVPDRDLYEKRKTLPSFWNKDHKNFYLMDSHEPPCTLGLIPIINCALFEQKYEIVYKKKCDFGNTITDPYIHSDGEFQLEVVILKKN